MHPNVHKVAAVLAEHGVAGQIVELTAAAPTAQAAADLLGCEVAAIANSLVFMAEYDQEGSAPVLVLTSGGHRVNTTAVAELLGARRLKRATPDQVRAATGQTIGGVAPVGHPAPVRTLVDEWLKRHERVWAAGGLAHTVFPTTYDELLQITGGIPASVE